MNNMGTFNFSLQNGKELSKADNFVILQAGKGKKDSSSIHINAIEFSYLEGIIWDNYREYGMKSKTKVTSHDWERIINGFQDGINDLSTYKAGDDIKTILKFDIFNPRNPLKDILEETDAIKELINTVRNWIIEWSQLEKTISIIKNHL